MATATVPTGWATSQEAAEYLGFKLRTLANWRSQGKGPHFEKTGTGRPARIRYRWADLDAWMTSDNT
jgi:hypothetical protein